MFEFFSKKKFLVDYLENFVDIHNHILPGIDDGAKNTEESVNLIKEFAQIGVSNFIATPHIMHNFYDNTPESIAQSLQELKGSMLTEKIKDVSIEAAAEHMIDDNFEVLVSENRVMPMKKEFILVEMSYLQSSINFDEAIDKTMKHGYFPILAHPERYVYLHKNWKVYESFKKKGISFQLNLLSLGDYYSNDVRKTAYSLLRNGLIDYVATDVHHLNHIKALKKVELAGEILDRVLMAIERTIQQFY